MNRVWIITGLVVFLIVGGAIVMSRGRHAQEVISGQVASPQPYAMVEDQEEMQAQPHIKGVSGSLDAGIDKWGRPVLRLDHLAGTLRASIPDLTTRERRLPLDHSCFRSHISPSVTWEGSPRETKSFVIFMERRMEGVAPYLTWALYNVPATYISLDRNLPKIPEPGDGMRHARGDPEAAEYVGPCDSMGKIPYVLRVFALDAVLDLPAGAPGHDLMRAMNGHIIDMA